MPKKHLLDTDQRDAMRRPRSTTAIRRAVQSAYTSATKTKLGLLAAIVGPVVTTLGIGFAWHTAQMSELREQERAACKELIDEERADTARERERLDRCLEGE